MIFSTSVRGARTFLKLGTAAPLGAGNEHRSTLPFGKSGSRSSVTNAEGIMNSGKVFRKKFRNSVVSGAFASLGTTYATNALATCEL
jgi:hypothetical protein